mmetsp:Transcript_12268/g.31541  ORF Transcript_12268/g.31541 Transcript_12268/m.31541 type:complete len:216 (-) Transcript_12268:493-1140(-)
MANLVDQQTLVVGAVAEAHVNPHLARGARVSDPRGGARVHIVDANAKLRVCATRAEAQTGVLLPGLRRPDKHIPLLRVQAIKVVVDVGDTVGVLRPRLAGPAVHPTRAAHVGARAEAARARAAVRAEGALVAEGAAAGQRRADPLRCCRAAVVVLAVALRLQQRGLVLGLVLRAGRLVTLELAHGFAQGDAVHVDQVVAAKLVQRPRQAAVLEVA